MKTVTKAAFIVALLTVTVVPVLVWAMDAERSLQGVAAFVGATTGPMGVLTGAMAAKSIQRDRNKSGQ